MTKIKNINVITIDGPAASGKSTISRLVAESLGWKWVSTGAFYRTIGLLCLRKDVDMSDEKQVLAAFEFEDWDIQLEKDQTHVLMDGKDVSDQIYQEDVGSAASKISQHQKVRQAILKAQRDCQNEKGLVAEGRDCGSVIFPEAPLKIFITADPEKRAIRRAKQEGLDLQKVLSDQKVRDKQDKERKEAPMKPAPGAIEIDNSELEISQAVDKILALAKKAFDSL